MNTTPRRSARPPAVPDAALDAIRASITGRRFLLGLSPESLSVAAGLNRSAVRQVEAGTTAPTLGTLYALAAALGCHPAELLGGRPPAEKTSKKS